MVPALLFLLGVLCIVRVLERALGGWHPHRPTTPSPAPGATPYRTAARPPDDEDEDCPPDVDTGWSPEAALVLTWVAGTVILLFFYGFASHGKRFHPALADDWASAPGSR
jgi:hypothetical protein